MSSDRLAEIERRARDLHDRAAQKLAAEQSEYVGYFRLLDVLALVEIARAAQEWASAERSDDIAFNARSLRAALDRLGSQPQETA